MTDHDLNTSLKGIQLKDGQTASKIFHEVLLQATEAFPQTFSDTNFPVSAEQFKKCYVNLVPAFETARMRSSARTEIAKNLAFQIQMAFMFDNGKEQEPLSSYLKHDFSPLQLCTKTPNSKNFWQPRFTYRKQTWSALDKLAGELLDRDVISYQAAHALSWLHENIGENGSVCLSGRKIAVLGANAEMASTTQFLAAGADVLWLDKVSPPKDLIDSPTRAGRLTWSEHVDLLKQPGEILATIIAFAGNEPIDLCLYAYAPGQARELKLTVAMNAIINTLPADLVRSITLLLSPTTATPLQESDLHTMLIRNNRRSGWEALLTAIGLLEAQDREHNVMASRTIVGIQGASYQAAQYLGKLITAESWASSGQIGKANSGPIRVSANTAAITRTRSMEHPIFSAAFKGASAFRVETFTPDQSRCLNGLLTIHDWLRPEPPSPTLIRVHGGIHTLPYPLESALRIAAAIGFARSPHLLLSLLR